MTKTFQVDEGGLPSDDLEGIGPESDWSDLNRCENDFNPIKSNFEPQHTALHKNPKVDLCTFYSLSIEAS